MPITQDRMILLVEESESAFEAMNTLIKDIRTTLDSGHMNERQKLTTIGATIGMALPQPLYTIIEKRHFKRFAKHNSNMKDKMYNKRHMPVLDEDDSPRANLPKHPAWVQSSHETESVKPSQVMLEKAAQEGAPTLPEDVARRQQESLDMIASEFPKRPIAPRT